MTSEVTIRPIRVHDRDRREPLWHGYLDFCRGVLTPEITERTWAALCDPTSAVHGLIAEEEDQLAGLARLVLHPTTWATRPATWKASTSPSRGAARTSTPAHRGRLRIRRRVRTRQRLLLTQEYEPLNDSAVALGRLAGIGPPLEYAGHACAVGEACRGKRLSRAAVLEQLALVHRSPLPDLIPLRADPLAAFKLVVFEESLGRKDGHDAVLD